MTRDEHRRMTAEEFDLAASVILLEGGSTREALRKRFSRVESMWSQDLIEYFRYISGDRNNDSTPLPGNSLSNLIEGFKLLRKNDPKKAISSFLEAFHLGLGSKLECWTSLGLFGIGASCLWIQRLDLARDAFIRCIESGWLLNDHAAVAKGFGGLGNLFMTAGRPHLAFDAYSTDLGFIQINHYLIPILRVRRSLAYAMTQGEQRGLGMLLAETGDFFDEGSDEEKYQSVADHEVYRGLAACSVVGKNCKTFDLLPELPEPKGTDTDPLLSFIVYHLAGMYHHERRCADHWHSARRAFMKLEWGDHPIRYWLASLLSKKALHSGHVSVPRNFVKDEIVLPQIDAPALSFLDRFREPKLTDSWADLGGDDVQRKEAIEFTLERGMLSNSR